MMTTRMINQKSEQLSREIARITKELGGSYSLFLTDYTAEAQVIRGERDLREARAQLRRLVG